MRSIFVLAITLALTACTKAPAPASNADSNAATFDWFEYSGNDSVFERPLADGEYRNPILAGFYPDPSVVRVGTDYYLVNSTFGYFPGIPVFHSTDLVNWTQLGNAIDRPDMLPLDGMHLGQNGVYAATIEYHEGLFYILNTCVACGGNFVITASDPRGPWSDPIWLPHIPGIDPSLFIDDDGRFYVVHHGNPEGKRYDAHTAVYVIEVDPETFEARSDDVLLVDGGLDWPWNTDWLEGPHIYRTEDGYLLSAAGGGTGYHHQQLVFRSSDPFGPYSPSEHNPVLTQYGLPDERPNPVTATGHADLFQDHAGDWWAVFLATRVFDLAPSNTDPGFFHTGRETFLLPVTWRDGWPIILDSGLPVPYTAARPKLPGSDAAAFPTTGNFKRRDEFDESALGHHWLFARAPKSAWWSVSDGELRIVPRDERMGDSRQPSFVGRRVQHMTASATTKLRFMPAAVGEEAGLLAVQNDDHYVAFGIGLDSAGETVLRVRRRSGRDQPSHGNVVAEKPVELQDDAGLYLRIGIDRARMDFSYSLNGSDFVHLVENADSKLLTTAVAGGFNGAIVGMYAEK